MTKARIKKLLPRFFASFIFDLVVCENDKQISSPRIRHFFSLSIFPFNNNNNNNNNRILQFSH